MTTQRLWHAIHVYPRLRGVVGFDALLASVRELLPCDDCRLHLDEFVAADPPDVSNVEALFAWTVRFHNSINRRLGRPMWTVGDARPHYGYRSAA